MSSGRSHSSRATVPPSFCPIWTAACSRKAASIPTLARSTNSSALGKIITTHYFFSCSGACRAASRGFLRLGQEHHASRHGLQQSVRLQQYACAFVARPAAPGSRAAVYLPRLESLATPPRDERSSGWNLSTIMAFSSGRPFAGFLGSLGQRRQFE